jgi:hypothetical protein
VGRRRVPCSFSAHRRYLPDDPPPILQTPECGMPSAITAGLTKEECKRMVEATLKENPGSAHDRDLSSARNPDVDL